MSFGFGLGDVIAVAGLANNLRKRFVGSPDQFRAISAEVKSLSNILRDLEDAIPERDLTATQTPDLKDSLEGCGNVLADLQEILDKYQDLSDANGHKGLTRKSRRLWKRLTFEPDDVKEIRSRLASNIAILNVFVGSLTLELSQTIKTGVDRLNIYQDNRRCVAIVDWLSDTNYPAQQDDIFGRCQEGTGQWLLHSEEYQNWLSGSERTLLCPGMPGAGKTFITSIVINDLQQRFKHVSNTAVAYIFCNYKREAEQTIGILFASLLKQIIQGQPDLYTEVETLYQKHSLRRTRPSFDELMKALTMISQKLSRLFIFVDALDECTTSNVRLGLSEHLAAFHALPNSNLFATSRFIPEIMSQFEGTPSIEIRATVADVRRYLEDHMTELPMCARRNEALQKQIISDIIDAVDGMFLLAKLHLGSLSEKATIKAYDEALERIGSQGPDLQQLAKQTISWIVCAAGQLSSLELRHALAVEDGASELDQDNVPDLDDIISVCAGLVTIDEDSDIVRLVHYTTQEYFERVIPVWAPYARVMTLETCLNYLSLQTFVECPRLQRSNVDFIAQSTLQALFDIHVFLQYALEHWHSHVIGCWDDAVEDMVLSFLEREWGIGVYWKMAMELRNVPENMPDKVDAMHFTAIFGLVEVALALLKSGHSLQVEDDLCRKPLHYAILGGHEATIKTFLDMEAADPNVTDGRADTPLDSAIRVGNEQAVKFLLDHRDIVADRQDALGYSPLAHASLLGRKESVSLLLKRSEVDVNCKTTHGMTPLHLAIQKQELGVVKLLLEHDKININQPNGRGISPLWQARRGRPGSKEIVELLLQRSEPNINSTDEKSRTSLHVASAYGLSALVARYLKRNDILVNLQDVKGRTALANAAFNGCYGVVELLLDRFDVDVNIRDNKNRTVLMLAYRIGHEGIVNLLEKAGAKGEIPVVEFREYTRMKTAFWSNIYHSDSEDEPDGWSYLER